MLKNEAKPYLELYWRFCSPNSLESLLSLSDLGFYEFRRQLKYKSSFYGTKLELVDRWFPSSKQCLYCKTINKGLKLSDRVFKCINPECGLEHDRDHHASLNLLHAPKEVVRSARP